MYVCMYVCVCVLDPSAKKPRDIISLWIKMAKEKSIKLDKKFLRDLVRVCVFVRACVCVCVCACVCECT